MKKIFLLMLACGVINVSYAQLFIIDGIQYEITSDSTCKVDYYDNNKKHLLEEYVIHPNVTYDNKIYKVDEIDSYALNSNASMKSVEIPNTIKKIGECSFAGCTNLKEVIVPHSVIEIGKSAFSGCTSLEKAYIGNGVTKLNNSELSLCENLKRVYVGTGLLEITERCFKAGTTYWSPEDIFIFSGKISSSWTFPDKTTDIYVCDTTKFKNTLTKCKANIHPLMVYDIPQEIVYCGKFPKFDIKSNVEGTEYTLDEMSLPYDFGNHKGTFNVRFFNDKWDCDLTLPYQYFITKAPLTIKANSASRKYGEENPKFTCSYIGFKNNETSDVLISLPSLSTEATIESNAGIYPIYAFNAEAQNYEISYLSGELTIDKAEQEIVWEQEFDNVHVGDTIALKAYSSSGLEIKYSSSDMMSALVYVKNKKPYVTFLKESQVILSASQNGNKNYEEADESYKIVTVKAKQVAHNGDANGDGKIDVADITTIAAYILGKSHGQFAMENADVDKDGQITVSDITATASIILAKAKQEQEMDE